MQFTINRNPYFFMVLVFNVAGSRDVQKLYMKSPTTGWLAMLRNWRSVWQYIGGPKNTVGKALLFCVVFGDGSSVVSTNAAPGNWQFWQTFKGSN